MKKKWEGLFLYDVEDSKLHFLLQVVERKKVANADFFSPSKATS